MTRIRYRPSRKTVFALLMAASGMALFLPPTWSDALKHTVQFLVPPQDLLYTVTHKAARSISHLDETGARSGHHAALLRQQLAAQQALIEQLREENEQLQALRDNYVPLGLPLLRAKVVARDIAGWRDSLLVERGSTGGVGWQDWVASRLFVDHGMLAGVEAGQAVLSQECLLGRIELVSPYMSRVQLFSDVDSRRIGVRVGAVTGGGVEFAEYPCSLHGLGRGRMVIEDVPYRYVAAGQSPQTSSMEPRTKETPDQTHRIGVGDLVFSAPGQLGLPVPMLMGEVVGIETSPRKRLVFDVHVEPTVKPDEIHDVFIIPTVPVGPIPIDE